MDEHEPPIQAGDKYTMIYRVECEIVERPDAWGWNMTDNVTIVSVVGPNPDVALYLKRGAERGLDGLPKS